MTTGQTPEMTLQLAPDDVVQRLLASANVCDQRKGRDLAQLLDLSRGPWAGRFQVLGFRPGPDRSLGVVCLMRANGLLRSGAQPEPLDTWFFVLAVPHSYPLAAPVARFIRAIPYCGHVVHPRFLPDLTRLPAELQEHLREGAGHVCWVRSGQWTADASNSLAVAVWHVSRLITFAKSHGEAGSVNPSARDYALREAEAGRLPLGPPLPYPLENGAPGAADCTAATDEAGDDDVEWVGGPAAEGGDDAD